VDVTLVFEISLTLSRGSEIDRNYVIQKRFPKLSFDMKSNLKMFTVIILLLTTALFWNTTSGQLLQARRAGATLPSPRGYSSAVFDEEDSVYIFGGYALHTFMNV
jgi:hypothetical protein